MAEAAEQALDEQAATLQQLVRLCTSFLPYSRSKQLRAWAGCRVRGSRFDELMLNDRVSRCIDRTKMAAMGSTYVNTALQGSQRALLAGRGMMQGCWLVLLFTDAEQKPRCLSKHFPAALPSLIHTVSCLLCSGVTTSNMSERTSCWRRSCSR
jgi:hypothetical protein